MKMKTTHVVLIVGGIIFVVVFGAFVLLLSIFLVESDEAERANAGKAVIVVRHEFHWSSEEGQLFDKQCIEHTVGVCASPPTVNPYSNRVAANEGCEMHQTAPQPIADRTKPSDVYEYEFELQPDKTYYWFAHVRKDFDCNDRPPAEKLGFKNGEVKLTARETKKIEADFTK